MFPLATLSLIKSYVLYLHPPSGTLSSGYGRQRRATERKSLCSSWGWWKVPWRNLCLKLQMTGRSGCKTRCMCYKVQVRYNSIKISAFGLCFSVMSSGQAEEETDHVFSHTGLKLETHKVRKFINYLHFTLIVLIYFQVPQGSGFDVPAHFGCICFLILISRPL